MAPSHFGANGVPLSDERWSPRAAIAQTEPEVLRVPSLTEADTCRRFVLPKLYAAGRAAAGIPSLPAPSYLSGLSLASCLTFGRIAGVNAAAT